MASLDNISITPLECGATRGPLGVLESGREGIGDLPAYAYLIAHPTGGMVVFDAGLPPRLNGDKVIGLFDVDVPDGQGLERQLARHDIDAAHIERIVVSHSHFDHIAGVELLPNAQIIINRTECEAQAADTAALQLGHPRVLVDGLHDVFGDGSVEVFPTFGHSCGHQSLRVRRGEVYDVLAGDACYFCGTLEGEGAHQPNAHDPDAYHQSLRLLQDMRRAGSFIVPGHDSAFLDRIPPGSLIRRPANMYWRPQ